MVGFFTPYSSTGENTEKVSLGVTALLSLAIILLMVADKMPATSKVIPLIGRRKGLMQLRFDFAGKRLIFSFRKVLYWLNLADICGHNNYNHNPAASVKG